MKLKKIIIISSLCLVVFALYAYYIYTIYYIHTSDEGSVSISCKKDPQTNKNILIEKTIIKNGKKIKVTGTNSECDNLF